MTVSTTTSRIEHLGDGVSVSFPVPFYFIENQDLVVYKNDQLQTISTHYTVSGAGDLSGGSVTFSTAPDSGDTVVIFRDAAITQSVDYVNNDPFPAETHERALDRLTMIAQRNRDLLDRSLVLPDSDISAPEMRLPDLETRKSKTFYWNSLGQPSVADVSAATLTFSPFTQTFSGDGSTTDFVLTEAPGSASALVVSISGSIKRPGADFSVSGSTLSFSTPPTSGTNNISVQCFGFSRLVDAIDSDAVSYTPPFASSRTRSGLEKFAEAVYVTDFYLSGDVDYTQAVIRAANSVAGPVVVCFPPGGPYVISSNVTISKDRIVICGFGPASPINFVPTADGNLFVFDKGAGAVYSMVQCILKDLAIYSTDTTYSKTALKLIDVSELIVDNVQTISPHWSGGVSGSTFAHILSRDTSSFKNLNVFADRPIRISPDPDASIIGIDHFNFHNLYLGNVFGSAYPLIEIDDGVVVTQLTFTGYQAWVGGAGGFKWTDTTTSAVSNELRFENVRYESNNDPNNKYMIEINRSGSAGNLQNFSIANSQTDISKGIYLRRTLNASFDGFWYNDSSREALNADSSVYPITTKNCFWQNGSTATLTGLELVWADINFVSGPVRENGFYAPSSSAIPQIENNATLASSYVSIAIDGVHKLGGPNQLGLVFVAVSTGNNAIFSFRGGLGTLAIVSDPDSAFSTTKNTGSKINVYWDAGNNRYEIQNKLAGPIEVYVQRVGRS